MSKKSHTATDVVMANPSGWNRIYYENLIEFTEPHPEIVEFGAMLKRRNKSSVLDLGSGDGRHVAYLAENGFDVVGVDNANYGIVASIRRLEQLGFEACHVVADMAHLPFRDNSFDSAISIQVIHHNTTDLIRKTFHDLHKILKPNALLLCTMARFDPTVDHDHKIHEIEERTFYKRGGHENGVIHHLVTPSDVRNWLKGFDIYRLELDKHTGKHIIVLAENVK
jgi:SAM-dependent methyltransferase